MRTETSTYSSLDEVYAKSSDGIPSETLVEHSSKSARVATDFATYHHDLLKRISDQLGIASDEMESRIFLAAYLHDVGKASAAFQARLRGAKLSSPPHPLLAWPFVEAALPSIEALDLPLEILAVLSHHTPYHSALYDQYLTVRPGEHLLVELASDFLETAISFHDDVLNRAFPFDVGRIQLNEPARVALQRIRRKVAALGTGRRGGLIRDSMALFVAAVHHGDWLASGGFLKWDYTFPDLGRRTFELLEKRRQQSADTFQEGISDAIQRAAGTYYGNLILQAPTGSGKTEAALLWAANRSMRKLLYLLPTRVTTNAMYDRLRDLAGSAVGLAHGSAALVIGEETAWDMKNFLSEFLHGSTAMKAITVATVDQVLLAKLQWTHWEMMESALDGANVILDEIHAYDLYTLSLIRICADELLLKQCRIALLSATLPSFIYEAFSDLDTTKVPLPPGAEKERHSVQFRDVPISDLLEEIVDYYRAGKKVLVVLNTVDETIEVFKTLVSAVGEGNALLLHSRFIEQHRREREGKLQSVQSNGRNDGFVAVTTQVVEVSLDIDFDLLVTQVAPADALAQRMGRVNRRGLKGIVPVVICQPDLLKSGRVYGDDVIAKALEILPEGPLRHSDIVAWVEKQYPKDEWGNRLQTRLEEVRRNVRHIRNRLSNVQTVHSLRDVELLDLVQTRVSDQLTVDVIPSRFESDARACRFAPERTNYLVRVPYWMVKGRLHRDEKLGLIADIEYHDELGVLRPPIVGGAQQKEDPL